MNQWSSRLRAFAAGIALVALAACVDPEVASDVSERAPQASEAPAAQTGDALEQIVVTGSRVVPGAIPDEATAAESSPPQAEGFEPPQAEGFEPPQPERFEPPQSERFEPPQAVQELLFANQGQVRDSREQQRVADEALRQGAEPLRFRTAGGIGAATAGNYTFGSRLSPLIAAEVPGSMPVEPGDEIWIIAVPDASSQAAEGAPGTGALLATVPSESGTAPTTVPLPLEHTDVRAQIRGYVGTVDVTQQFTNPYDDKIEAVYMFPLPEKAAVREFVMTIGERKIRGILREKQEAEQLYREARAQGYRASLLVQHRPSIFEQRVANIEPGQGIDVSIRYLHTLAYHDGWYTFVFPTVVGPRYNPAASAGRVAAVPRTDTAEPATGTAVRYLRPNERSTHDLGIRVDLDAGVPIEALEASLPVETERDGRTARIELAADGVIPNRDFTLRIKVAGDKIKSSLMTYVDPETNEGYFTAMMYPPADLSVMRRQPVEMVFVLDTSGSMNGRPIEQAKRAMLTALDRLEPEDTFQIIRFASSARQLGPEPLSATDENLRRARRYIEQVSGGGGTEMLAGIRAALGFEHDESRLRFVTLMTDGYIGNEAEIIGEVHRLIGDARIFSFGVGSSVNRFLLERLASEGRGAVAYLGLDDSAEQTMAFFFERISHPALTDLSIDFGAMNAREVYPSRLPDLFVGRPVVVTGKFAGEPGPITVHGRVGGRSLALALEVPDGSPEQPFLPSLWARLHIADLVDKQTWSDDPYGELAREIRDTALAHGLMSAYTSFIAVDASERTAGTHGTTVYQPVPVPDGVRYDTTVVER